MTTIPAQAGWRFRKPSVIPGFGLTLGFSLAYLTLIILIPLAGLAVRASGLGWSGLWAVATDARVLKALQLSFGASLAAAVVNVASAATTARKGRRRIFVL